MIETLTGGHHIWEDGEWWYSIKGNKTAGLGARSGLIVVRNGVIVETAPIFRYLLNQKATKLVRGDRCRIGE